MAAKSDGAAAAAGPGPEGPAGAARGGAGGRGEVVAEIAGPGLAAAGGPGPRYELRDCCWVLCALLVFFSDGATDLWLAASYYLQGQSTYFGLTLLFVLLPSLVVQLLSFRWFVYDYSEPAGTPGPAVSTKDSDIGGAAISTKDSAVAFRTKEGSPELIPRPSASSYRRRCCRLCVWLLQTLVHLLQLGQVLGLHSNCSLPGFFLCQQAGCLLGCVNWRGEILNHSSSRIRITLVPWSVPCSRAILGRIASPTRVCLAFCRGQCCLLTPWDQQGSVSSLSNVPATSHQPPTATEPSKEVPSMGCPFY